MQTLVDVTVPLLTFILLTAVGLDLTAEHFDRIRRQRQLIVAGLLAPLLLLPPIAAGLAWVFRPALHLADGLLLIAVCPIGGISSTYTYLARASTALSVTLTTLSCLLAGVTIPLVGRALEITFGRPVPLPPLNGLFLGQLVLMLTVPVVLGMWIRLRWTDLARRYEPAVRRLAFAGVAIVFVLIVLDDPWAFLGGLPTMVPLAAVFVVCSALAGWMTASLFTRDPRDRFAIATEFGTRNLGVAMAIAVTLLGRTDFARFAYTYFLIEMPLMLAAIAWYRRGVRRPEQANISLPR
jgi:bile acid:Na+ symporter, BASS family